MMVKKDFEIIAREFGWDFHLYNLRYSFESNQVVLVGYRDPRFSGNDAFKAVGTSTALFTLTKAFTASNPRFNATMFYTAINKYADKADEIGNGIFK